MHSILFYNYSKNCAELLNYVNNKTILLFNNSSDSLKKIAKIRGYIVVDVLEKTIEKINNIEKKRLNIDLIITSDNNYKNYNYPFIIHSFEESDNEFESNILDYHYKCLNCFKVEKKLITVNNIQRLIDNNVKYCSQNCNEEHLKKMEQDITLFEASFKTSDNIIPKKGVFLLIPNDNMSLNNKINVPEKFQESMKKEAIRLDYAVKREKYKKEMKQVSLRKSNTSAKSDNSSIKRSKHIKTCKARTKKGKYCTNKSVKGSDYCGILSHRIFEKNN